ncbi:MAG TPA: transcription elongation factor GreA [Gaiellales bacterium]|jgi:transcription elongation factor GreA
MSGIEVTPAELAQLTEELAHLEGPRREEAVNAIATARAFGDLSENFEYHAAKDSQGLLERQITILRAKIQSARVVEAPADTDRVHTGSRVTLEDEAGDRVEVTVTAVGGVDACSPDSPLGRAIQGAAVGDRVQVDAPRGSWTARIVAIA